IVEQLLSSYCGSLQTIPSTNLAQPFRAGVASRDLRSQIAFALVRCADVIQEQGQNVTIDFACTHDPNRRNAQPFLIDLATQAHRSGISPTYIRMMCPRSRVEIRRNSTPLRPGLPQ